MCNEEDVDGRARVTTQ